MTRCARVAERRQAIWKDAALHGLTQVQLVEKYHVATSTITRDLEYWTMEIAKRCVPLNYPYLHLGRAPNFKSREWLYYIRRGPTSGYAEQMRPCGYYRLTEAVRSLLRLLEELGIDHNTYPF
jgi:hypothetical protein